MCRIPKVNGRSNVLPPLDQNRRGMSHDNTGETSSPLETQSINIAKVNTQQEQQDASPTEQEKQI